MSFRHIQLLNLVIFQSAWFASVLGAAHSRPLWGTAAVLAALLWHLAVSARPLQEAKLITAAVLIGFGFEAAVVWQGHTTYTSGQPYVQLPPYWMVALWGLFGMALNVTLRWLKNRWVLAAVLGAVLGPLSYASGVRLGAAQFTNATAALTTQAMIWAVAMPVLMRLSNRFDGVRTSTGLTQNASSVVEIG
jgi:Protein of unknown function (DUF2878)